MKNAGLVPFMVRDVSGAYLPATIDQILGAARQVIDTKFQRGAEMNPGSAIQYLKAKLAALESEVFAVLFLDCRNRLIQYEAMFQGTVDGAAVYPREVVRKALEVNASKVIFGHNHPSGIPDPSSADRLITARLKGALELIGVGVLDHIVIGADNAVSLAERGWL